MEEKKTKNSLRENCLFFIKMESPEWVNGGEIERYALKEGYKASNASRRLRELCEEGRIERRMMNGVRTKTVWYRYIKPSKKENL